MPIDPSVAVGAELGQTSFSWESSDVLLYHLGIGAGADPLDSRELRYAYEKDLRVLPTFATVAATMRASEPPRVSFPGIEIDLAKVVHGSQSVTAHRPLPVAGKATASSRITDVFDKGKAAVIVQETDVTSEDGEPLWTAQSRIFARGEGGFGGDRGPSERIDLPDREPDVTVSTATLPQQALLYRLCGDRNPLHADPDFAQAAGFDQPILHGLCTYGVVAKAVTDAVLDGDPTLVRSWSARFAGIVLPGETLRTKIWELDGKFIVSTESVERSAPVLADAVLQRV
ncbi:MaoC/PaaZ C-terminal domain-containing protein [Hoyosella subflava]|uniref:3-alpha,7-alpha,12-alpha-trihydroxy-5-beta-chole st-24-enoyl-CoAhydratase n=1 Tax=Hoyosella subflava (strain DSM 45089 / JCM 17490 / NBRC 109087 / DQS3-9A1) TaxID=443218 RepID=F6EN53_HOYSD|nr:MaoC/PaaZ C-terminal domain-containing protein [Hoyosella subflava]AEF39370.1 3-alpha,7-alpha,12-alpha-trihydroxy-5-beta-chole st-24-enoyl-CoAhydratase [Hoyosella subflava DQS3-9A1]